MGVRIVQPSSQRGSVHGGVLILVVVISCTVCVGVFHYSLSQPRKPSVYHRTTYQPTNENVKRNGEGNEAEGSRKVKAEAQGQGQGTTAPNQRPADGRTTGDEDRPRDKHVYAHEDDEHDEYENLNENKIEPDVQPNEVLNWTRGPTREFTGIMGDGPFRFQVVSDVHVEFYERSGFHTVPNIPPLAPILVLAGDIGLPAFSHYSNWIASIASKWKLVIVVAGNHEYYHAEYFAVNVRIRRLEARLPNVVVLERDSIVVDGVRIVGGTLWPLILGEWIQEVQLSMNDYYLVRYNEDVQDQDPELRSAASRTPVRRDTFAEKLAILQRGLPNTATGPLPYRLFNPRDSTAVHIATVDFLEREIEKAKQLNQKIVVVTHHPPLYRFDGQNGKKGTQHPNDDWPGGPTSPFMPWTTDLSAMFGDPIAVWVSGHTHFSSDFVVNGTRLVSNQMGYPGHTSWGNPFDPKKVVTLD